MKTKKSAAKRPVKKTAKKGTVTVTHSELQAMIDNAIAGRLAKGPTAKFDEAMASTRGLTENGPRWVETRHLCKSPITDAIFVAVSQTGSQHPNGRVICMEDYVYPARAYEEPALPDDKKAIQSNNGTIKKESTEAQRRKLGRRLMDDFWLIDAKAIVGKEIPKYWLAPAQA